MIELQQSSIQTSTVPKFTLAVYSMVLSTDYTFFSCILLDKHSSKLINNNQLYFLVALKINYIN